MSGPTDALKAQFAKSRLCFFDCDGVIFDSNGFKLAAMLAIGLFVWLGLRGAVAAAPQVPQVPAGLTSVWAQYTIRLAAGRRSGLAAALKAEGVL